jgi:hypothetical protein
VEISVLLASLHDLYSALQTGTEKENVSRSTSSRFVTGIGRDILIQERRPQQSNKSFNLIVLISQDRDINIEMTDDFMRFLVSQEGLCSM